MDRFKNKTAAQEFSELLRDGCIIVDFETTGFPNDPRVDIIEIGIIDHQGTVLMNTLVKPRGRIPFSASNVNGIYDHDVKDAPPFPDVYPELARILNDARAIAYNHEFERGILKTVCTSYDVPRIISQWRCAMRGYQRFRMLRGFAKLVTACEKEGIVTENAHRALGDCIMTLALIQKMAEGGKR